MRLASSEYGRRNSKYAASPEQNRKTSLAVGINSLRFRPEGSSEGLVVIERERYITRSKRGRPVKFSYTTAETYDRR